MGPPICGSRYCFSLERVVRIKYRCELYHLYLENSYWFYKADLLFILKHLRHSNRRCFKLLVINLKLSHNINAEAIKKSTENLAILFQK